MLTGFYAGLLACLYMKMSLDTIAARRKHQVSLGTGQGEEIVGVVSAHLNFASYVPLLLILLYLVEISNQVPAWVCHPIGIAIFAGRVLHYRALIQDKMNFKWRVVGMHLTLWPLLTLGILCVYSFLMSLF
ncbi:hypothetical protein SAMN06296036_105285 [Pseudobacteriovorax antillogorgiicola]|uniref:MAPEG family protein n=1 Tax=Pseudobacteriovorax antillogorgiicola TaxID=1513793 RepID=A0A1Y6BJD6_9BACT|nr:hypothetical protein EDD56_10539 [Pseudobacteriovorax antillogorgiicola]SMF14281.1 hypothetical protein SAMN06296036_105285 [Pseudobacteriovorax antillogorgiicola]